ncbi:hypothetical protein GBF38_017525 [Nibea albiflora]|uniref:Uncharacterized protein n=1 Tax=Nibea albiflora TaxID=240163 RepID=A0ACB7FIS3_NIBAL|nr:hypothetical protein GBF38_017525 [Nibea albiflora]
MCKRAAEKLEVPWPVAVAEPTRSRYEGKRLPLARSAVKQLIPVFPELLAELSKTWSNYPYSNRSPIPGAASLPRLRPQCSANRLLELPPSRRISRCQSGRNSPALPFRRGGSPERAGRENLPPRP